MDHQLAKCIFEVAFADLLRSKNKDKKLDSYAKKMEQHANKEQYEYALGYKHAIIEYKERYPITME